MRAAPLQRPWSGPGRRSATTLRARARTVAVSASMSPFQVRGTPWRRADGQRSRCVRRRAARRAAAACTSHLPPHAAARPQMRLLHPANLPANEALERPLLVFLPVRAHPAACLRSAGSRRNPPIGQTRSTHAALPHLSPLLKAATNDNKQPTALTAPARRAPTAPGRRSCRRCQAC